MFNSSVCTLQTFYKYIDKNVVNIFVEYYN